MPRIYDGASNPLDFCTKHFPSLARALVAYGKGTGPDNRGNCFAYDAEHPDYDGENYDCTVCGKRLTAVDNG